jgi:hypothetical protein
VSAAGRLPIEWMVKLVGVSRRGLYRFKAKRCLCWAGTLRLRDAIQRLALEMTLQTAIRQDGVIASLLTARHRLPRRFST